MATFVLMGVSGAGKTTIGTRVAAALRLPFFEGDDYHPAENVAKMSSGIPLTDADRGPWIEALVAALNARPEGDAIVACSALSTFVRERLRSGVRGRLEFIWLTAQPEVIEERLKRRPRHFMKAGMLASQFAALQMPSEAHQVSVDQPLDDTVKEVLELIVRLKEMDRVS